MRLPTPPERQSRPPGNLRTRSAAHLTAASGDDLSLHHATGTKSWWVHLVHSGIERICRPGGDDLLQSVALEGGNPTCSGITWYTPGGLISQVATPTLDAARHACTLPGMHAHAHAHAHAHVHVHAHARARARTRTRTHQVVTLTLLDIVFLVLNELLWGLLWTVVSRLIGRRCYAQSSINAYYDPPEFLFADRYAYMLKIAAMVLVFAPAVPPPHRPKLQPRASQAATARLQDVPPCACRCRCSTGWAA